MLSQQDTIQILSDSFAIEIGQIRQSIFDAKQYKIIAVAGHSQDGFMVDDSDFTITIEENGNFKNKRPAISLTLDVFEKHYPR
jgi:hypothetical protein